jgi:D-alanyl-D-alanine carboxypeptidase
VAPVTNASLCQELQRMVDALVQPGGDAPVGSAVVHIEAEDGRLIFEGAAGVARPDTGAAMSPSTGIHIASVAKTFTATLVLQLAEEGRLGPRGIDAPFGDFKVLSPETLRRLHCRDSVSHAQRITLRQLLTHTTGIRDAMVDDAQCCAGPAPGSLIGELLAPGGNPARAWVPWDPKRPDDASAGVINFFINRGIADQPLFLPGEGFHYSDTGFVLLGLLVQTIDGRSLHASLRARILEPLGLSDTYLAYRDDPALGPNRAPEAEVYAGDLPILTSGGNLSFDWAGGGLVSTVSDLATFLRGLLRGQLFRSDISLAQMTQWVRPAGLDASRTGVGLGLFRTPFDRAELWGRSGAWGTKLAFEPRSRLVFSGTTNQARSRNDWHHPFIRLTARHLPSTVGGGPGP